MSKYHTGGRETRTQVTISMCCRSAHALIYFLNVAEAVQRRLETLQQFKALRLERPVLIKHGRRGFPHKSHLVINEERLYWNWKEWKKLSPSPKNVPLATVTTVVKGRRSKVLKRVSHKKDKLLFTVVSATKELHLQVAFLVFHFVRTKDPKLLILI